MMDYVDLLKHVKYTYSAHNSPVIAFGGSYGGMLTAWMRMKYPHVINGAIAASAPILYFEGGDVTPESFFVFTTRTFAETKKAGQEKPDGHCAKIIRESWDHIMTVKQNINTQASKLKEILKLCKVPKNEKDIEDVYEHFASGLQYEAMTDYPTKSDFLEPMPPNPVNVSCSFLEDIPIQTDYLVDQPVGAEVPMTARAELVLKGLNKAAEVYFNYKKDPKYCANFDQTDATGSNLDAGRGWDALACN